VLDDVLDEDGDISLALDNTSSFLFLGLFAIYNLYYFIYLS
jgi:hypothetical protein